MFVSLRSIAVGAAALLLLGVLGWFAIYRGDASDSTLGSARPGVGAAGGSGAQSGGALGGPVSVIVATVNRVPFAQELESVGNARANESVDITAKTSNRITTIRFREGQQVKAGDVLVEFDGEQARANLAEAEAALLDSRSQYQRSRELFATQALSAAQLDQLQATLSANEARVAAARSQLNDTIIRAPFAGRMGLRNISVGSLVSPGTVITTLDDASVIKLDFSVPEAFLATLAEGLSITARTSAYPEAQFKGKVMSIDNRLDPVSRAVLVRGHIDNKDGRLRPGMFMTVKLTRAESPALMIPEQALIPEGDRKFVFAVRAGKAMRSEVHIGRRRPGEVEITGGLVAGDVVIVEGTQKVRDGVAVKVQPSAEGSG